jgi:GNAT superfamily N-acetyltransferase
MSIRDAQSIDAKQISILSCQFGWNASEEDVKSRLEVILPRSDHKILVYENEVGEILGWIHARVDIIVSSGRYGEILAFVVREGSRGLGTGRELLSRAEHWIKHHEYNATSIVIRCNNERRRTHAFYTRNGYSITMIGLRKQIGG